MCNYVFIEIIINMYVYVTYISITNKAGKGRKSETSFKGISNATSKLNIAWNCNDFLWLRAHAECRSCGVGWSGVGCV